MTAAHKLIERLAEQAAAYHFKSRGEITRSDLARNLSEHFAPLAKAIEALRLTRAMITEHIGVPRYTMISGAALSALVEDDIDPALAKLDALREGK